MSPRYLPVDHDYHEMISGEQATRRVAVVHYFREGNVLGEEKAKISGISRSPQNEEFVDLDNGSSIRIDRIIVINGKPGPAYDEYDAYALACLDCMGGMD